MSARIEKFPSRARLLFRGLTRRCAWCGDRKAFFVGWFKRQDQCRRCGHGYRRGDHAFELGANTANIILTFGSVLVSIVIVVLLTIPTIRVLPTVAVAGFFALVGPLMYYPISYTLWQAIDLSMRPPTKAELAGEADARL